MTDIATAIEDRAAHRDILARYFHAHPLTDISPDDLERLVGRNYQQRISDCRLELDMTIENVPRSAIIDGRTKRLSGAYRFRPTGPAIGRDAGQENAPVEWPTVHSRPFQEPFRLKP